MIFLISKLYSNLTKPLSKSTNNFGVVKAGKIDVTLNKNGC